MWGCYTNKNKPKFNKHLGELVGPIQLPDSTSFQTNEVIFISAPKVPIGAIQPQVFKLIKN